MINLFPQTAAILNKLRDEFNEALGKDIEQALSMNPEVLEVALKLARIYTEREGWFYMFEVRVFVENAHEGRELSPAHSQAVRDALKQFPITASGVAEIFGASWEKHLFRKKDGSVYSFSLV